MRANYLAPVEDANVVLPPMDGEGLHLRYLGGDGQEHGGFVCISYVGASVSSCIVQVDADAATHAALQADASYELVEVLDG